MITYLLIGIIYGITIEWVADHLEKEYNVHDVKDQLTFMSRVMGILLWPIMVLIFVTGYLKGKFKK